MTKTIRVLSALLVISIVFVSTATAYDISGYVTNNSAGINGATVNYNLNSTSSNDTGYYFMNNLTGNIIINFTSNPVYYSNSTSINMDSNKTLNINLIKKPTGTITGRVCSFPGCQIEQAIQIISSNRIRWFF